MVGYTGPPRPAGRVRSTSTALERFRGGPPATPPRAAIGGGAGPGTALERYRGGPPAMMRGSQNLPVLYTGPPGGGRTTTPPPGGGGPVREALEKNKKKGFSKRGLLIGAGAAVVAGLAYSGRRGEGSSGGRTSQYRY